MRNLTEHSVPFATQLGFHELPNISSASSSSSGCQQNELAREIQTRVLRLGHNCQSGGPKDGEEDLSSAQDSEHGNPRVLRLGHDSFGSDATDQEHLSISKQPSVLRLACKNTAPKSAQRRMNEGVNTGGDHDISAERGGGDDEPPYKRSKYNPMAQTSSLSTSLPEIPYEVFDDEGSDYDHFRELHLLLTLSPVERLDQLLREEQGREESDTVDVYKVCNPTPYLFQPDRWSCGYQNLRMLLGSLRVLKVSEDKRVTTASTVSRESGTSERTTSMRALPLDISERMMAMAGVGETSVLSTQENSSSSEDGGSKRSSNKEASTQPSENGIPRDKNTRIVAHSASLRGGYERTPSIEGGVVPSVLETQILVEQAWQAGYDPEGLDIFRPEGVRNNERWIGEALYDL